VDAELSKPRPDHQKWTKYVDDGIGQALGAASKATFSKPSAVGDRESNQAASGPTTESVATPPQTAVAAAPAADPEATQRYVGVDALNVRLAPNLAGAVTNKIYRHQVVGVLEVKDGWARISPYYDGEVEAQSGQVARWVNAEGLVDRPPAELPQPEIQRDPRIAQDAFSKVGHDGMTEQDLRILYKGANKYLAAGQCDRVEFGDKSIDKPNTYYINCGGRNIFFTKNSLQ
jgi:hypothetical protein